MFKKKKDEKKKKLWIKIQLKSRSTVMWLEPQGLLCFVGVDCPDGRFWKVLSPPGPPTGKSSINIFSVWPRDRENPFQIEGSHLMTPHPHIGLVRHRFPEFYYPTSLLRTLSAWSCPADVTTEQAQKPPRQLVSLNSGATIYMTDRRHKREDRKSVV